MPRAPLNPCAWRRPLCPKLTPGRYCPEHQQQTQREDQVQRGTAAQRGYDAGHRTWRGHVLARDPWCRDPDRRHPEVRVPSLVADHIVPLRVWEQDPARARAALLAILRERGSEGTTLTAWSLRNGQGLCLACHNAKARSER